MRFLLRVFFSVLILCAAVLVEFIMPALNLKLLNALIASSKTSKVLGSIYYHFDLKC